MADSFEFQNRPTSKPVQITKSPYVVQQWIDTLPEQPMTLTSSVNVPETFPDKKPNLRMLGRDLSVHSEIDACSHCSSVESVLELRKPDPEAVLLGLGFGPNSDSMVSRIPPRFLQPSKLLKNIDFNKFLEEQGAIRTEELQYNLEDFCPLRYHSVPSSPAKQRPKTC